MSFKKADFVLIIVLAILTVFAVDLILVEEHRSIITNLWASEPFQSVSSGLIITFIVCLIGNLSPVPTPYSWVVCAGFIHLKMNIFIPLLFAFVASIGCLLGEMGGYILGRGTALIISEERTQNLKKYEQYLVKHPRLAPILIFIFGLTPLNDDLLIVPLGLIKYSPRKTMFWCWLGKLGMMSIMAYNVLGICNLLGGSDWVLSVVFLYVVVFTLYIMVRVNLVEIIKKLIKKESKEGTTSENKNLAENPSDSSGMGKFVLPN